MEAQTYTKHIPKKIKSNRMTCGLYCAFTTLLYVTPLATNNVVRNSKNALENSAINARQKTANNLWREKGSPAKTSRIYNAGKSTANLAGKLNF